VAVAVAVAVAVVNAARHLLVDGNALRLR